MRTPETFIAVAACAVMIVVAGCGSSDTKTVTETVSEETATAESDSSASQSEPIDNPAKSGGIEVAVRRAFTKPTVSYVGGTDDSRITPNGEPRTVNAPQGGSYVYVDAKVTNETSEGLDLTCGYPMEVKLLDASGRRFDPVEGLDLLKGNPECNAQLQPGFTDKMIYVFLVPPGAKAVAFRFARVTPNLEDKPPAEIAIPGI